MIMQAGLPRSVVIHFLPSFSATAAVVPEPPKKSAIKLCSVQDAWMIRSKSSDGFCVL
jgi:hypothetical protein